MELVNWWLIGEIAQIKAFLVMDAESSAGAVDAAG
jgi:hypothetical protein